MGYDINRTGNEPAFPVKSDTYGNCGIDSIGISKREYAAIKLRVPDSGEEWLDEMIIKSNRNNTAKDLLCSRVASGLPFENFRLAVITAYELADELFKQENL